MAYDIYAMYLTHFYTQRDKSAEGAHSRHSLHTVRAFLLREWMLVLHHLVLLVVFLPVVLVRNVQNNYKLAQTRTNTQDI